MDVAACRDEVAPGLRLRSQPRPADRPVIRSAGEADPAATAVVDPAGRSPRSWQFPAEQQPAWPDPDVLATVTGRLRGRPALVAAGDCGRLRQRLAAVARGGAFLVQAGDCAETFADATAESVTRRLRTILRMALVLRHLVGVEPVVVGRMAGQYAKPRPEQTEVHDGVRLPAYRGDAVNDRRHEAAGRVPDPRRLLAAYDSAAAVLHHLRGFVAAGGMEVGQVFGDLRRFVETAPGAGAHRPLVAAVGRAATGRPGPSRVGDAIYTSHEALLLDSEAALLRAAPGTGQRYGSSGHLLWIGDRTRQLDGAHVEFASQVANPIAVKLGPQATPAVAVALAARLDPRGEPGRLTFVTRFGAGRVRELLAPIVAAVTSSGARVGWVCDPMHGNTRRHVTGLKTRLLTDIIEEVRGFFEVHRTLGTWPGGLHLEFSGDDVTECLGGSADLQSTELTRRYETACDPRLNPLQCLDLVASLADLVDRRPRP